MTNPAQIARYSRVLPTFSVCVALLILAGSIESARSADTPASAPPVSPNAIPPWSRPLRMPERIPLTHADPPIAIAGEFSTLRVPLQLSKDVPPGAVLKLQISGKRNNRGDFPGVQAKDPKANGYVSAQLDDGTPIAIKTTQQPATFSLFVPSGGLHKGQKITVVLGDRSQGAKGVRADNGHVLNKFFVLYDDPGQNGKPHPPQWAGGSVWNDQSQKTIVAACTVHIIGGHTDHLRAYAPSTAQPRRPVVVLVRPEDRFSNLAHDDLGPITISLGGKPLEATFQRVPGSVCVRATVSLPSEGVHRLQVRDATSGLQAIANPTRCSNDATPVYWGMIHGHTEMSDGVGHIDDYFHQLKDEVLLDFAASSDHDHLFETPDAYWAITCQAVKRWNKPHEFVAILGYEWAKWRRNGDGDRNVYYATDDRPMYRSDTGEYPSPPDLFAALHKAHEKAIVIPHHPAHGGNFCDWKDHDPEYERLVEICQVRGSYECAPEDGNPLPEKPGTPAPFPTGYARNALATGWRVGFTGGGDDHAGQWGTEFRFGDYKQGLMSVEAPEKTREAVFQAMYDRRTVATSGARILLSYHLNERPIGSELNLKDQPGLAAERRLVVEFHGTAPAATVDIIRNNQVVHSEPGNGRTDLTFTWCDTTPLEKTWMPAAKYCDHPFTFYYVRVIQSDHEVAWASPVWVDP